MKHIDISDAKHPYEEWKHAAAQEKKWKGIKDDYWQEIQDRVGQSFDDADALVIDGKPVMSWTTREESRISVAELRKGYPEIAAKLEQKKSKRMPEVFE
ncbi:hypothetical protein [Nocardia jiangxiensis]|uniref:hypothetical protein n=1 Tax=Nocardia jiangxiensis TaxID=282685 RepID=UPI0002F77BC7|nr:hypothetical protein [Nocardia jiangxiensis]